MGALCCCRHDAGAVLLQAVLQAWARCHAGMSEPWRCRQCRPEGTAGGAGLRMPSCCWREARAGGIELQLRLQ